ncbi:MAG: holo-ACP synthase [Planctomycetota bacterium]|nr:holo-ACP synthase [Planctomycetota bacterium]
MNVVGIGTDIVQCSRIESMIAKHDELFLKRVYTEWEINYCSRRKSAVEHFAGRWAAKEAILKAMGTGWAKGVHWTDLEIRNEVGGQPFVQLAGEARTVCQEKGIGEILISLSHCREYATAFATALGCSV